jgi:ribosomal protein S18 acetylase RimI-like enzyme
MARTARTETTPVAPRVRPAAREDLAAIIRLDERNTGFAKPDYWRDRFERYAQRPGQRYFLVAEQEGRVIGFVIGEVRAWEFGSPPCGWVFAIGVDPDARLRGVGSRLLDAVSACFKEAGVTKLRTMLARDDNLNLSFFRSQGMMAGPFIQLEKDLD